MLQELVQSTLALSAQLKKSRQAISSTTKYLGEPGCNVTLGEAHLAQARARHSAALTGLRANRVKARELIA